MTPPITLADVWARCKEIDTGCTIWTGYWSQRVPPRVKIDGRRIFVAHLIWELHHGPVPSGRCVLHQCGNAACVRLEHLSVGRKPSTNVPRYLTLPARDVFMSLAAPVPSGCIEWQRTRRNGYGTIRIGRRQRVASRVSWEIHHGPIPDGLVVRHKCDNPPCVNPDHLEVGTAADNNRDARERKRSNAPKPPIRWGETNHNAKLTAEKIRKIREAGAAGLKHHIIARKYGATRSNVQRIIARKAWAHVN